LSGDFSDDLAGDFFGDLAGGLDCLDDPVPDTLRMADAAARALAEFKP
jgi:hypothetical protein